MIVLQSGAHSGRPGHGRSAIAAVLAPLKSGLSSLAALTLIGACTTQPTGPRVLVLPSAAKTLGQFRADDVSCRQYALEEVGRTPVARDATDAQGRYDVAYVQCMYASGHRVPVPGGAVLQPDQPRSLPAPPPSAAPPKQSNP